VRILVDADACPVTEDIIEIGRARSIAIVLVCDFRQDLSRWSGVEVITADGPSDAADWVIAGRARAGDIVVTQDYGLASLVLAKGCAALSPRGRRFTAENIDLLLAQREATRRIRRAGGKTKGPSAFTPEDRAAFRDALSELTDAQSE
jgi:uncharacterized protein YaiI (UPF0178 family)